MNFHPAFDVLQKHGIRPVTNSPDGTFTSNCKACGKLNSNFVQYDDDEVGWHCHDCGDSRIVPLRPAQAKPSGNVTPPGDGADLRAFEEAQAEVPEDDDELQLRRAAEDPTGDAAESAGDTYSHIWRSKDYDFPCSPTGEERRAPDGRIFMQVRTPDGGQNFVPKDELVPEGEPEQPEPEREGEGEENETPLPDWGLDSVHEQAEADALEGNRLDAAAVRAALENASKDKVVELFVGLALSANLNPVELDTLLRLAAKKAEVGLRPLSRLLKQAQDEQAKQRDKQARARQRAERSDEAEQLLAELNRDNRLVLDGGKVWVLRFEQVHHNPTGRRRYTYLVPIYLRTGDFRTLYLNRRIMVGARAIDLGKWWLHHRQRRQYFGVVFEPGGKPVVDGKLNLWTGWGVKPKRGDWGLMRKHVFEVLAARDEAVYEYILNWLAWAVQHPGQQPETALVFLGQRGTGRGVLGNAMCRIFGNHGLHISSPHHLVGHFNAHLRQCGFLFADEAYAVADRSAEGRLKALITEETIPIEAKGKDVITAPNHLHVMMASNEDWVIPAGQIERRFVVQEVADHHAQEPAYFKPLFEQLDAGGLEAMLLDLLNRKLGDWHPRQIVRTTALARQQAESLSAFDAWWEDLLHDGYLPAGDSVGRVVSGDYQVRRSEGFFTDNSKKIWYEKRKGFFEQARIASPDLKKRTDAAFGRYLTKRKCISQWVLRQRGWRVPELQDCRAEWLKRFPATVWRNPNVTCWQGERDQDDDSEE
jgi:hypothetical protein